MPLIQPGRKRIVVHGHIVELTKDPLQAADDFAISTYLRRRIQKSALGRLQRQNDPLIGGLLKMRLWNAESGGHSGG